MGHFSTGVNFRSDTGLAGTGLVSHAAEEVGGQSGEVATGTTPVGGPERGEPSVDGGWQSHPGGMESVRSRVRKAGLSVEATELFTKSWRAGTRTAYKGPWEKWASWCARWEIDPFRATVENMSNFLTEKFQGGGGWNTAR